MLTWQGISLIEGDSLKVSADYICEHGMPSPWATCTDCMLLPHAMQPRPPAPEPPPEPAVKKRASRANSTGTKKAATKGPAKKRVAKTRAAARLPKSITDKRPALSGDKDMAYEIPEANLRYHAQGPDSTWLPISTMPKELRDGGYLYLQADRRLIARCRVKGIGFRDRRWTHEAPGDTSDAGPGATLELHKDDWDFISIDLGAEGEATVLSYRYLTTDSEGVVRPASAE